MIILLHVHRWAEVGRKFNPPALGVQLQHGQSALIERLAYGVTVVEQRCRCGDIRAISYTGDSGAAGPEQAPPIADEPPLAPNIDPDGGNP